MMSISCSFKWSGQVIGAAVLSVLLVVVCSGPAVATPSTQIWNPSTDIQAQGTWHLGIDNYFTVEDTTSGGYAFPTDLGVTYGLLPGLEVGVDSFLPQTAPGSSLILNAKYGIAESEALPAVAVGGFGFGLNPGVTDQNIIYGVVAKTFPLGRLSAGYFKGKSALLGSDGSGAILTWDKALTDKIWACVDYASGDTVLGALFAGVSYAFAPNTSVILGYGKYNNGAAPTITTQ
ncbi:MAG: hypothetical protein PHH14_06435, partial [Candidatus Margulisbacteria bacterium]|nr:hypothetical protein [Candidatus Margulisiibacteriota bacterium]